MKTKIIKRNKKVYCEYTHKHSQHIEPLENLITPLWAKRKPKELATASK